MPKDELYNLPPREDKYLTEQEVRAIVSSSMENFSGNFRIKSGSVSADGGTIQAGSGNSIFKVKDGLGIWLGNSEYSSAPFKVSLAGALVATKVSLTCSDANAITIDYGSDILLKHGGDIKFTSVTAPTACTAALAGAGAGNVDNGDHIYKITFVNEAGETELGTASNTVTVSDNTTNGQVNLTDIPVSPSSSVTSRKIYRTKAGGTDYYLVDTISDNTTTTYTDNTADASLTGSRANFMKSSSFGKLFIDNIVSLELGGSNTFVGQNSGKDTTTGYGNTFLGYRSGYSNTTGYSNTFLGYWSGYNNTTGYNNAFLGIASGYENTTGYENIFLGYYSGHHNDEGNRNTFLGCQSGFFNSNGKYNTANGYNSLYTNSTGFFNTAFGYRSLQNVIGSNNVALGSYAGYYETGSNAFYVNNQNRTDTTGDKTKSLIYGVFDAAVANQKLTINGDVGIGTTAPSHRLHIKGLDNYVLRLEGIGSYGSGARLNFGDGDFVYIAEDSDDHLYIYGNQRTAIMGGNVGIGEAAPDYKLDVNGTFGFTPGSSVTPVDIGDVVVEATNDTTLTFKLKGSDGTVRSGTIALA